jgi:hypothetical protein
MRVETFLEHHGIASNPFAEEDAQTDPVFKNRCRTNTFHPSWDKVFGDPSDPATSIVFGEKGAGKTAMRLQIMGRLAEHNEQHPQSRTWVIEYDDFNPFLDHFADRLSVRKQRDPSKVLADWKLWDHMDAILSLGVTNLVDLALGSKGGGHPPANKLTVNLKDALDQHQKRDLLLLAACYDDSLDESFAKRWSKLRSSMGYYALKGLLSQALGIGATMAIVVLIVVLQKWDWLASPWPYIFAAFSWMPAVGRAVHWHWRASSVRKHLRVLKRDSASMRRLFARLPQADLHGQPLPDKARTDDRYELLAKLQGIYRALGYTGIEVLVDRVDEPHQINGKVELMRDFVWSMLDNKFLKQPGFGIKLLLPAELIEYLNRETRDFHQRARIDKQNLVPSLDWTGEALFDLANARIEACALDGKQPTLRTLFAPEISDQRLIDAFRSLRVPRNLFKFLYRMIVGHCNAHTQSEPVWQIPREAFEASLAVFSREQAAVDRGLAAT